jgi:hypothetical protein
VRDPHNSLDEAPLLMSFRYFSLGFNSSYRLTLCTHTQRKEGERQVHVKEGERQVHARDQGQCLTSVRCHQEPTKDTAAISNSDPYGVTVMGSI